MTSLHREGELKYESLQAKSQLGNQPELHVLLNCDLGTSEMLIQRMINLITR